MHLAIIKSKCNKPSGEEGYTLVAVLAFMTVLAILALSAVPNLQRQAQREREEEAIFRGEQVQEAIKMFIFRSQGNQPPTSIDQLLEGVPVGSKKLQILRASSAKDPLSKTGEWKLVRPNSAPLINFQTAINEYAGKPVRAARDPRFARFAPPVQAGIVTGLDGSKGTPTPATDDPSEDQSGPFIGVTSRSEAESIINYYGINHHNEWVFTPLFRNN